MPNTFIKPTVIAAATLGLLQRKIMLPGLVWTDAVGNFGGSFNDTISIRVPGRLTARRRDLRATGAARNIVMDNLTETKVDVTLDSDVYSAVPVTDEELTLDIKDFGVQILEPQTRAVGEGLENDLAAVMQGATYDATVVIDPANTYDSIVDARKALNDRDVPFAERRLVVGSGIEAAILKDDHFNRVDQSGTDSALREAFIGRIAGFDVYTSNALAEDEGYAFHRTAYVMTMRAPVVPDGASFGQSMAALGLAMRWLRDYDFTTTTDRSLVDCYVGFATVPDDGAFVRSVRLQLATASISVAPATSGKAAGATTQLTVTDANDAVVPAAECAFVSSDPTKATVNAAGLITFVATGASTITATYQGHTDTCVATTA